ncbi:hypothetical protein [Mycoavidus cysteinexigens]|nr:hypothetical protein [Mycoavidus cysteinexigens]GAM53660.1 hypothetical protein EBME_2123 [bacterium endosymbiont of Mortierella elongata FMR23-6]
MGNTKNSESSLAIFTFIWIPEFDQSHSRITLPKLAEVNVYNANTC